MICAATNVTNPYQITLATYNWADLYQYRGELAASTGGRYFRECILA